MLKDLSGAFRLALAAGLALLPAAAASSQDSEPAPTIDPRAVAAVERSWATEATYALYAWNWVREENGQPRQAWSAEFHDGVRHRVETPTVRVVADCEARTGTAIDLARNETVRGTGVANIACGLSRNAQLVSLEWLGRRDGPSGPVDMVRLTDPDNTRTYAVDGQGVLVAAEIFARAGNVCLQQAPVAVENRLPEDDIFSEESLGRSVVPERMRGPLERPSGNLWLTEPSCF